MFCVPSSYACAYTCTCIATTYKGRVRTHSVCILGTEWFYIILHSLVFCLDFVCITTTDMATDKSVLWVLLSCRNLVVVVCVCTAIRSVQCLEVST